MIKVREGINRQDAAPIETHSVVASHDKERDVFEVFATVQSVHGLLDSSFTRTQNAEEKNSRPSYGHGRRVRDKGRPGVSLDFACLPVCKEDGANSKMGSD